MWFFKSPEIVFGEDALSHLAGIEGERALIVTDRNLVQLGLVDRVREQLAQAGIEAQVFDQVEPDPSLGTVKAGAQAALELQPDWIIGLGGGSCLDAAKAIRVLYERPDLEPEEINPIEPLGLRGKARLIAIPTTSGTGAEVGWAFVLTDPQERRKLVLGTRESFPDLAILDPALAAGMPPWLTADTGMDVLTHAVEIYAGNWHNDFVDGPALKAIQLVFTYLPRAHRDGSDMEAREHMHNAAALAGFGLGNANAGLAHAMGHSVGGVFHPPHGRTVGLLLPYTMEFVAREQPGRYAEIARFVGLAEGAASLIAKIRELSQELGQPASLRELGLPEADFQASLDDLVEKAEADATLINSPRIPSTAELRQLFLYAYEGKPVDF